MRRFVMLAAALAALCFINLDIWRQERLHIDGQLVFLELAPVDPRSLMQGDYMALRFKLEDQAFGRPRPAPASSGKIVAQLDEREVASFVRLDDGTPLEPRQVRLRYRLRDGRPSLATNAFFFQEGHAKLYAGARYGELRVSNAGEAALTGLRDAGLNVLGPGPAR